MREARIAIDEKGNQSHIPKFTKGFELYRDDVVQHIVNIDDS